LQVHPSEDRAKTESRQGGSSTGVQSPVVARGGGARDGGEGGGRARIKHEAWYVIESMADAVIYRGLRPGVDPADFPRAVVAGRIDDVVERIPARKGHAYFLPSGTVHALGGGILVAEVQTPSDTTYRIYDWDRVDASGKPRELHVQQAISSMSPLPVPKEAEKPQHVASVWTSITSLIRCESFVIERVRMVAGVEQPIPYAEMVIWIVLEGGGRVWCKGLPEPLPFGVGDTILLPAGLKEGRVRADDNSMWLEVSVPVASSLSGFERPARESFQEAPGGGLVPLNLPPRGQDEEQPRH
jgi:mannose-6-phosphate isomerase